MEVLMWSFGTCQPKKRVTNPMASKTCTRRRTILRSILVKEKLISSLFVVGY
jgi:hypothetical protein